MHRIFKKKQILTIPNLLSLVRLALIPVIVWLYSYEKSYYAAIGVILLSGATDIVDGWIARHFNMVSDFGKILDPIADKLTQAALLICLLSRHSLMWGLIIVFAIREIAMIIMGLVSIKKSDEVNSAQWYGKLNTVVLYGVMMALILFPSIPDVVANIMITGCGVIILLSLVLYARFYIRFLRNMKNTEMKNND
ncbi:MAG: CDP-alcohol phosphatidyltransferase family protein [Clostridia bacterium]|nr:CDP-alcohol phosphatidyltransferase family protein [Clostridia bacterium]